MTFVQRVCPARKARTACWATPVWSATVQGFTQPTESHVLYAWMAAGRTLVDQLARRVRLVRQGRTVFALSVVSGRCRVSIQSLGRRSPTGVWHVELASSRMRLAIRVSSARQVPPDSVVCVRSVMLVSSQTQLDLPVSHAWEERLALVEFAINVPTVSNQRRIFSIARHARPARQVWAARSAQHACLDQLLPRTSQCAHSVLTLRIQRSVRFV